MNKLLMLVVCVAIIALLWWALTVVLAAFAVPAPWSTLAVVAFVLIAAFAVLDFLNSGTWFWRR